MTILERYLIREMLAAWAAVTVVLLLILVSSYVGRFLARIAAGEMPGDLLFSLLALKIVGALGLLLPAALFLSAMLALGRLYRDSEMVVMSACGVGPGRLYRSLAWLCVPAALALALISVWLAPQAAATGQLLRENAAREARVSTLQPGRFQRVSDGRVVYVGSADADAGSFGDMLIVRDDEEGVDVVTAERARYYGRDSDERRYLVMESGHRAAGEPGRADFRLLTFETNTVRLPAPDADSPAPDLEAMGSASLLAEPTPRRLAEFHWRLAQPISLVVLALLVVPASRVAPRESRYSKLVLGLLIYLAYANLLGLGRVWLEQERIPLQLGLWWVHALFTALAVGWVKLQFRRKRRRRAVPA